MSNVALIWGETYLTQKTESKVWITYIICLQIFVVFRASDDPLPEVSFTSLKPFWMQILSMR